jgi:hypothetical protein
LASWPLKTATKPPENSSQFAVGSLKRVRFPTLALLARKYLQIPATSAAYEQFFSQGALNITKQRN